jgi:tRNA threonylcarbamoyladenosine biosynthesis protein TsaB
MNFGIRERLKGNKEIDAETLYCSMLDARRMEVYYSIFNTNNIDISETKAEIITELSFSEILEKHKIIFFGDGADKCKSIIKHNNALFIDKIYPQAKDMSEISYVKFLNKEFENVAYFEPYYLKEFIAKKPNVKGLL